MQYILPPLEAKDIYSIVNIYNKLFPEYEIEYYSPEDENITTDLFVVGDMNKDEFYVLGWYEICMIIIQKLADIQNITFSEFLQLYTIPKDIKIISFLENITEKLIIIYNNKYK